jgi:SAM-dependent methyltransferase
MWTQRSVVGNLGSIMIRPRTQPSIFSPDYVVLRSLHQILRRAIAKTLAGKRKLIVLDIGCGSKPYESLFEDFECFYIGTDLGPGNRADVFFAAESLGVCESSVDVVLCTQVLEHVEDPVRVASEIRRILKPDGVALVATHGVWVYHPSPEDYWRWTQAGLHKLFSGFGDVEVLPNAGSFSCICTLLATYFDIIGRSNFAHRWILPRLLVAPIPIIHILGLLGDKAVPLLNDPSKPNTLFANFLVVARP